MTDMTTITSTDSALGNDLQPAILTIFGITGDLSKRKVLPAIYHLIKQALLPEQFAIVGTSRREINVDELLKDVELCVLEQNNVCDPDAMRIFKDKLQMIQVDPVNGDDYAKLKSTLDEIEAQHNVCMTRLIYLSIPPQVYSSVIKQLGQNGLNKGCQHDGQATSRLLVEKPFGYDYKSAEDLIATTNEHFSEDQVFRIDHFLAKETAQNILTFRRYNPLFSSIWNNEHISGIDIYAHEKLSIEGRADFYDHVGAMRDLIQSHLLQLLAITTMDLPTDLTDNDAIHENKQTLLELTKPPADDQISEIVIRAQYDTYRTEVENDDSTTETFVSLPLHIDNDRWQDVPIRITTGKALGDKATAVVISFSHHHDQPTNKLTFRVQPNDGIDIDLQVKKPGYQQAMQTAKMDFSYQTTFDETGHPDAYERVLIDAVRGDHMLFATSAEVMASWRILQPVLNTWEKSSTDLKTYQSGSMGPELPALSD
jgi:glucose-6-phosphate 1-dehydrogenase